VVVVSHDRYFLDRTVDRLFSFENGQLERFEGNYSSYLERQQYKGPSTSNGAGTSSSPAPKPEAPSAPATTATKTRRRSFKETRELEQLDAQLPQWEERRGELEGLLAVGGSDYAALEALSEELSALLERIARGEERWLELSELAG
jgi:ATP-binding cassette subfamily F protein uup